MIWKYQLNEHVKYDFQHVQACDICVSRNHNSLFYGMITQFHLLIPSLSSALSNTLMYFVTDQALFHY